MSDYRLSERLGERLGERLDKRLDVLCERLSERLGDRLGYRLGGMSGERLFQWLDQRLGEIKKIHSQLPSPKALFNLIFIYICMICISSPLEY